MSLRDFISTNVEPNSGVITLEGLERFMEQVKNAPPDPCSLGKHVVSLDALRRGGWTRCANCYGPVHVEKREL